METLLVTKPDFAGYADLPESLDMERLTPHVLAVQRTRLRPLLTESLATELLRLVAAERAAAGTASPAPLTGAWAELRPKAVAVVACAALARYTPFSQNTYTAASLVRKTSQYSEPVEGRELARMASVYDGDALSFEVELRTWLTAHAGSFVGFYPVATCCGATPAGRTPSVVVQAIGRPDNRPISSIPSANSLCSCSPPKFIPHPLSASAPPPAAPARWPSVPSSPPRRPA